jgi:SRSO17 transposase
MERRSESSKRRSQNETSEAAGLAAVSRRFVDFVTSYSEHFRSYRHDVSEGARQYCCGLMQAGTRKNMDRMAEVVAGAKSRNLQQFLTHSRWSARAVMDHVAKDADAALGDGGETGLLIDESGFAKQGGKSVGAARQWLGRLGKVDNGQVAVFGALARGTRVMPVDARLYLPEEWTKDPDRCREAGIPEAEQRFRTKRELALEVVRHARENRVPFDWLGADAGYGKGFGFMREVADLGETFVVDVHVDTRVYLQDPKPYLEEKPGGPGRPNRRWKSAAKPVKVKLLTEQRRPDRWTTLRLRQTSRGDLTVQAFRLPVYVWDGESARVDRWTMVVTRVEGEEGDLKISLSNAPESTSLQGLAWRQRQRYWVERTFEDAKGECGMADYQVRKWSAWHHHMALVMMSMLFMLREKQLQAKKLPLLSCADIEELLTEFLPRQSTSPIDVLQRLRARHAQRQRAIESHRRRSPRRRPAPAAQTKRRRAS